jgi:hypothetical protein
LVAEDIASLYAASTGGVAQVRTAGSLIIRYGGPGTSYRLIGVRIQDRLIAAAIVRLVDRAEGIRAAVIMDVVYEPDAAAAGKTALAGVERLALREGCDVVLFLDGVSRVESRLVRHRGYLASPEKYTLLCWTDRSTDPTLFPKERGLWRFTFGDHDTF